MTQVFFSSCAAASINDAAPVRELYDAPAYKDRLSRCRPPGTLSLIGNRPADPRSSYQRPWPPRPACFLPRHGWPAAALNLMTQLEANPLALCPNPLNTNARMISGALTFPPAQRVPTL